MSFLVSLVTSVASLLVGMLLGWSACRGMAISQAVQDEDGAPILRVTTDPGTFPWSGAETILLDASEQA